jgi:hypothetical protein
VTFNDLFKLRRIQEVSPLDGDAVPECSESIWRANRGRHGMAAFNRLPNEFQSGASCGSQYNQFHAVRCGAPSALRFGFDVTLHIGYR